MFVLHVELEVKPEQEANLEEVYREIFQPAISGQDGFCAVDLLRPKAAAGNYCLSIAFDHEPSQQKWVATELHGRVWAQIETQCIQYSVNSYTTV